jgi:hypothetical protein
MHLLWERQAKRRFFAGAAVANCQSGSRNQARSGADPRYSCHSVMVTDELTQDLSAPQNEHARKDRRA